MYSVVSDAVITDIADLGQIISDAIMANLDITNVINAVIELDTSGFIYLLNYIIQL